MMFQIAYKREDRPNEIAVMSLTFDSKKSFDLDAILSFKEKNDGSNTVKTTKANIINYHFNDS